LQKECHPTMVTSGVFCGVVKILEKASQELRKREFS